MSFYDYRQNNSGGSFNYDGEAGISHFVIIEADSAGEADDRAERIGLYFDGSGDCQCCGDRWYPTDGSGDPVPAAYGEDVLAYGWEPYSRWMAPNPEGFIHYADGTVVPFGVPVEVSS